MSVSFTAWLGETDPLLGTPTDHEPERAVQAWKRITDKPRSIVFANALGVDIAAQTVRLEYDDAASLSESAAGVAPVRKLVIFGVKGHPTVADTVIGEGYTFVYQSDEYKVIDIIYTIGEVQGIAEAVG